MSKEIIVERGTKTVYREGSKIVKQFKAGYPKSAVIKEAFNHALAEESGLNVPALLEVKNTGEGWALVIEAVEGKTMAQLMAEQPENLEALMTQFVEIQSDIHHRTCKQMGRLKDKLNAQISSLRDELDASTRYELHVRLENMKAAHQDHTRRLQPDQRAHRRGRQGVYPRLGARGHRQRFRRRGDDLPPVRAGGSEEG